jgi:hypothetical protein
VTGVQDSTRALTYNGSLGFVFVNFVAHGIDLNVAENASKHNRDL